MTESGLAQKRESRDAHLQACRSSLEKALLGGRRRHLSVLGPFETRALLSSMLETNAEGSSPPSLLLHRLVERSVGIVKELPR